MTPEQYELVEAIFSEACELSQESRESLLVERCAGDALVRAEVEAFLAADEGGDDGLSAPAWPLAGDVTQIDVESADLIQRAIPERIGRYRILRECGRGGMGVVYEAEQESPSRRVALKVIRTGVISRELLRRFQNEAEVLGRLQHPGIAQIFEAGSFDIGDGGQPFFAMEFVDGSGLLEYAADQALDTRARLSLFTRICDALHYAHEKGVIHRDLKPENVFVARPTRARSGARTPGAGAGTDPGGTMTGGGVKDVGQPKILDFGVARMTDADVQLTTMHTVAGQIIGTIQYMSPEQAAGDSRELDVRSDVYSLGVVLFELLGRCLPYDLRRRSIPQSVRIIQEEEPKRLSSVDHAFHGDIETIVGKCLEKEPDRRYQSAAELGSDIWRHLRDEPISARQPSSLYQLKKFTRRNRALVGGVLATVAALIIGIVATTTFAFRANESAEDALRQAYVARLTAATALGNTAPQLAREQLLGAPDALRGWEWRHLDSQLDRYARTYVSDSPATGPIAYLRGGEQLVSALVDGRVAVWDSESAELVRVGEELAGATIRMLAVPSGGPPLVACGTEDGQVRVWDLDADRWLDISREDGPILDLAWDRAGTRLLFSTDTAVYLSRTGQPIREHAIERIPDTYPPVKLGFGPDGRWYAASTATSRLGRYYRWDAGTGEQIIAPERSGRPAVRAQGVSHDATRFAVPGADGLRSCALVDARTGETQLVLRGHNGLVAAVAWTPDDTRLITSSYDGTIRLWSTSTGASLAVLGADPQSPLAVAPDGSGVAYRGSGTLRFWDFSLNSSTVLHPDVSYVYSLAYSLDGTRLATTSSFQALSTNTTFMDPLMGRVVRTIDNDGGPFYRRVVFSLDGAQLEIGNATIDVATGAVARRPGTPVEEWMDPQRWCARFGPGMVLSADGQLMATAGEYRAGTNAVVRDIATGETVLEVPGSFWGVALSPDGALLAASHGQPGHIEIWSLANKRKLLDLPTHGSHAYCVDFHPDGTRLASGGNDNAIRLWDTTTWEPVLELRGHTSYVKTVVFSPDGTQLASGSGDLTVRIWDTVPRSERHRRAMAARGH